MDRGAFGIRARIPASSMFWKRDDGLRPATRPALVSGSWKVLIAPRHGTGRRHETFSGRDQQRGARSRTRCGAPTDARFACESVQSILCADTAPAMAPAWEPLLNQSLGRVQNIRSQALAPECGHESAARTDQKTEWPPCPTPPLAKALACWKPPPRPTSPPSVTKQAADLAAAQARRHQGRDRPGHSKLSDDENAYCPPRASMTSPRASFAGKKPEDRAARDEGTSRSPSRPPRLNWPSADTELADRRKRPDAQEARERHRHGSPSAPRAADMVANGGR